MAKHNKSASQPASLAIPSQTITTKVVGSVTLLRMDGYVKAYGFFLSENENNNISEHQTVDNDSSSSDISDCHLKCSFVWAEHEPG